MWLKITKLEKKTSGDDFYANESNQNSNEAETC